jgi:GNAT superfamily N-acetyltransferase
MIEYRKADASDAAELAKIRGIFLAEANDVASESARIAMEDANRRYFEAALADGGFAAWLALDGGEIVATSGLSFSVVPPSFKWPDGKVAYIMNMYTIPEYRRRGVGTELLRRIVGEAKAMGYKKITLTATQAGRPLYEKFGFRDNPGSMVYYI